MTTRHPYDCHVRLSEGEYLALQALAARADRSLTAQIRYMLRDMLASGQAPQAVMTANKE